MSLASAVVSSASSGRRSRACAARSARPGRGRAPRTRRASAAAGSARCAAALLSVGRRKNWSRDFSSSLRWARNSPTTVPIVWRSLTRRYSSSIHGSSGSERPPSRTRSMRPASCTVRAVSCRSCGSRSSKAASRYSTEVATSIASSVAGGLRRTQRGFDRVVQRLRHRLARRMQLLQRFAELGEGVGHLPRARNVAARERRPHFLGGLDALACLCQHQRVEAAELLDRVVDLLLVAPRPRRRAPRAAWRLRRAGRARPARRRTAGPGPGGRTPCCRRAPGWRTAAARARPRASHGRRPESATAPTLRRSRPRASRNWRRAAPRRHGPGPGTRPGGVARHGRRRS